MPGPEMIGGVPVIGNGGVILDQVPDDAPVVINGTQMGVHRGLTTIAIDTNNKINALMKKNQELETKVDEAISLLTALLARED